MSWFCFVYSFFLLLLFTDVSECDSFVLFWLLLLLLNVVAVAVTFETHIYCYLDVNFVVSFAFCSDVMFLVFHVFACKVFSYFLSHFFLKVVVFLLKL